VHPVFWLPERGLAERAKRDRVPYDVWVQQGLTETTPGGAIGYDFVAHRLRELIDDYAIKKIAFDPWGMDKLKTELARAEFPASVIEQSSRLGKAIKACRRRSVTLRGWILGDKLRHGMNPVMNWCVSNAAVITDPAGIRSSISGERGVGLTVSSRRRVAEVDGAVRCPRSDRVAATSMPTLYREDLDLATCSDPGCVLQDHSIHYLRQGVAVAAAASTPEEGRSRRRRSRASARCAFRRSRPPVPIDRDHPFRTIATTSKGAVG
jgi:hypothetical protein